MRFRTLLLVFLVVTSACAQDVSDAARPSSESRRTVAVTIDDLPTVHAPTLEEKQYITRNLLEHLRASGVPATGFVNEGKLGERADAEQVALLEAWLDAGMTLGNHTYSHASFFTTPLEAFKSEVLRGEVVTKRLLRARGDSLRYFRHPYLNTGPDRATRRDFEDFLAEHGYTVAPVTLDNDEWLYAFAYTKAEASGDTLLAARIGADYLRYMAEVFEHGEALSRDLLEREPAQVLLLHANKLNADYFDDLATMMQGRGYAFVSLEEALEDPAYRLPDEYVGQWGISWLERWWVTQGNSRRGGPNAPQWVHDVAYPDGQ